MTKMRAAVLEEFGAPLVVQEVELADPKAGEVLVRLVACGVCHTDMYTASGADPSGYAPAVLGHEGAGVVEAIGEGVTDVAVGDHVVTLPSGREVEFEVDEDVRYRLLGGHDDIGLTLQRVDALDEHERERERPGPSTLAL